MKEVMTTVPLTYRADSLEGLVELEPEDLLEVCVEEAVDDEVSRGVQYQKQMVEPTFISNTVCAKNKANTSGKT